LDGFLSFLNIKDKIDTYHIGFVIGPRINAGGRIASPYDSLNMLLYSGDKQLPYLQKIDDINTERKQVQEDAIKIAKKLIKSEEKMLIAFDESFNE
jgi:single-stranded-DNA-specific exonuclease